MDKDQLKRMLAGLSIAGLISGAGFFVSAPDALSGSS
ncbi:MAG: SbtA family thio(seleno)oxazole RiPP natural product precursor [Thermodesulfovibrionia bacterium]